MDVPAHFIPDRTAPTFYPLRSFLRVPSANVAAEYIQTLTAPGDLIIDPFAATPTVARVAQQLGRRAIAVESNPLWSWIAHTMATLPTAADIDAALAGLGDALKDDVPLRTHILRMYETLCATCRHLTPADYFVHTRDVGPVQRHYTCVHCGETRDDAATEDDLKRSAAFDARGFHYHFALARVMPTGNLHAERIRKMLDLYTPRNLSALVALTAKTDALFHGEPQRDLLLLLILHLLDRGTSLYTDPSPEATARLATHKQFVEFNLWNEIETAAHALSKNTAGPLEGLVQTVAEVVAEDTPRAFVGRGSAKALARTLAGQSVALVVTAPPVRQVGVWALSYFWGAWILGRGPVDSLVGALDPHKEDPQWAWEWYLDLVAGAISASAQLCQIHGHCILIFGESRHDVMETLLLAGAGARFELTGLCFQPPRGLVPHREFDSIPGDYRIALTRHEAPPLNILAEAQLADKIRKCALTGCREILTARGEPLAYSWVHHAAYTRLMREGLLSQVMSTNTKLPTARFVSMAVREGLYEGYAHDLDHYDTPNAFLWTRSAPLSAPLMDRVDDTVREFLRARGDLATEELEDAIYRQFRGELTPEAGLVEMCARAYADLYAGQWHSRGEDGEQEKVRALQLLTQLGERLEFGISSGSTFDLIWESDGEMVHGFVWRARGRWDDLAQMQIAPAHGYMIVPEAQTELVRERARALPLQAEAFREAGWDYMRIPFVERLLEEDKVERQDLVLAIGLSPLAEQDVAQLGLF